MKIRLLFVVVLLVLNQTAFSQDYTFKVLVTKGKNQIRKDGNWQPIKVGSALNSIDELKVSENSYVGLVHVSGKPYEVKNAGQYKVVDLSAKVGKENSVLNKYTDFILSSNDPSKNNMTATGAVHRGGGDIVLFLPQGEKVFFYNDSLNIEWLDKKADKKGKKQYTVKVFNLFDDLLIETKSLTNNVVLDLGSGAAAKESEYRIEVSAPGSKADAMTIRRLQPDTKKKFAPLVDDLRKQNDNKSGLAKLMEAGVYEQNGLIVDAASSFQQAVRLEPALKDQYEMFLVRNALKKQEKK